jgi:hypothetical protein
LVLSDIEMTVGVDEDEKFKQIRGYKKSGIMKVPPCIYIGL